MDILFHGREAGFSNLTTNPKMEEPLMFQPSAVFLWGFMEASVLHEYIHLLVSELKNAFLSSFYPLKNASKTRNKS